MVYTLALVGIKTLDFVLGKDDNDEVALVMVEGAKYVLNYHPNTVISNTLQDFKIDNRLSVDLLIKKIK